MRGELLGAQGMNSWQAKAWETKASPGFPKGFHEALIYELVKIGFAVWGSASPLR